MKPRPARVLIWTALLLAATLSVAALAQLRQINLGGVSGAAIGLSFGAIGGLIALKVREDPLVGLIFLGIGLALALSAWGFVYSPLFRQRGVDSTANLAAWLGTWTWQLGFFLLIPCLLVLFPDGRPVNKGARKVLWISGIGLSLSLLGTIFNAGNLPDEPGYVNPFGLEGATFALDTAMMAGAVLWLPVAAIGAPWSLVIRYRSSRGAQRQQLKWFVYAGVATVLTYVMNTALFVSLGSTSAGIIALLGTPLLPLAAAIAIFRYRLYDIDRVINRTIVYSVLTILLISLYVALVIVLQAVLRPLTPSSDLAIVASTLAVAAIFNTARRRVQAFVDRRFYRRKYDAQRMLEEFASRLRDEVDMTALMGDVRRTLNETLQPAHLEVWLRPGDQLR